MPGISRTRWARLGAVTGAALSVVALLAGCGTASPVALRTVARVQVAHAATSAHSGSSADAARPATANGPRRVTFINRLKRTVWVAASPDTSHPMARTGWVLRPGKRVTVSVPNHWNGRFWGRTGCVFHGGRGHCQTGDCAGRLQCRGWGTIPATLAEYDLDAWDNLDFYDVSMVDGSNLPMYIYPTSGKATKKVSVHGCVPAGCTSAVRCPKVLKVDYRGKYVACESACARLGGDQYCCRGKWAPRSKCNPRKWPVDYARVFKRAEPYAYSYSGDDATSVYTCSGRCDYHIVFGLSPRQR